MNNIQPTYSNDRPVEPSDIPVLIGNRHVPQTSNNSSCPLTLSSIIENFLNLSPVLNRKKSNITIKRSNKAVAALNLPTVVNLNPRSVYNKVNEFHDMMDQYEVDLCLMSESWERDNLSLREIITLENFDVVTNVVQRQNVGGKPAIIVNSNKYFVQPLCPEPITVPVGLEIVWVLLTPKDCQSNRSHNIKKIAAASIYSKPNSRKKTLLLDHIAETFNYLSARYSDGIHFILAGDTNDLNLSPILALSPNLKQVVNVWTRHNPDRMLDPIITTLSKFYHSPLAMPPLDPDPDKTGSPSDHNIVLMRPVTNIDQLPARITKTITFRPMPESGIKEMGQWISMQDWVQVTEAETAHEKANILQNLLMEQLDKYLPNKIIKLTSDDQPWFTNELKEVDRKRKREYLKNKKSAKWEQHSSLNVRKKSQIIIRT